VYSEKNTGTVFHIYLPCSKQAVITDQESEVIIPGSGTILLVDDEEIIRITGKSLLKNMGYDVLTAENGKEGLEIFREKHTHIDAITMDMIMPEMDGHEAFLKMKEIDNRCKIIISSGFSKNESLIELRKAGLAGFIRKPFRDFELSNLLAKILGK
jgi:CheY-like chemotaxis protein